MGMMLGTCTAWVHVHVGVRGVRNMGVCGNIKYTLYMYIHVPTLDIIISGTVRPRD